MFRLRGMPLSMAIAVSHDGAIKVKGKVVSLEEAIAALKGGGK